MMNVRLQLSCRPLQREVIQGALDRRPCPSEVRQSAFARKGLRNPQRAKDASCIAASGAASIDRAMLISRAFFSRRRASRRSPAIARAGIAFIALDKARQKIEKKPAFPHSERSQELFLSGQGSVLQPLTQLLARAGSAQQSCPAIIRMHATLEQARRFEPVDHFANTCRIDAKPLGQPALVEARQVNDCGRGWRIHPGPGRQGR